MEHLSHSFFTVWRFESPITGDSNIVARDVEVVHTAHPKKQKERDE